MINRITLLSDLQKLLQRLEADLLERSESAEVSEVGKTLRAEYDRAKTAERTAQNYEDWRTDAITQAAAAWVLSSVFVRFLEDNRLIDPPKIAGPGDRLERARDEHELYFRSHPKQTDREYLLALFDQLGKLPGTKDVFGEHNPVRELPNWLSGDAAGEVLRFFQKIDANTGSLVHDFTDPNWDTRFLGDLYQDLSEAARKKYALLQTPEFVEEFILDRTLDPSLVEFGLDAAPVLDQDGKPLTEAGFRMIDPACGSGHFLLGAFPRILDRWQRKEPGTNVRELVQRTLDSIHGVDVNPYAVAIARFRLLLAALKACGVTLLADAPGFVLHLACGDSLLHSPLKTGHRVFDFELTNSDAECEHAYKSEDLPVLKKMLHGGQYHAVVANPPYIVPKDRQLNERYRKRFKSCHMKYSLAVPFLERIFRLAVVGGYTGQITANSFMKREFGKKLIEAFLPVVDLTHVIDTAGAYIPGHGTPTVILFGRNRKPVALMLRTVMGIIGEPATPDDPAHGLVWTAIVNQLDQPGSQSRYISVNDSPRKSFHKHPWSIGGGGASELKELIDEAAESSVGKEVQSVGLIGVTGENDFYSIGTRQDAKRIGAERTVELVEGDVVRDWSIGNTWTTHWTFDDKFDVLPFEALGKATKLFWTWKQSLNRRRRFGTPMVERGATWYEWQELYTSKFYSQVSIAFGEVSTHNHFVFDRGGKVFNRTAPVIKLSADATEDDHLALLGVLNCSITCFWLKQGAHNKGDSTDDQGSRTTGDVAFNTYAFNSTLIGKLPLPSGRPLELSRRIDALARAYAESLPEAVCKRAVPDATTLAGAREQAHRCRGRMIALQEELDWQCYRLYGLIAEPSGEVSVTFYDPDGGSTGGDDPLPIALGQRAFEIVLARQMQAGAVESTWFTRHGSTPITEIPAQWPEKYRTVVQRRIDIIESDNSIGLIEKPEYKRRWNTEPWDEQQERALKQWLLDRMESYFDLDGKMNEEGQSTAKIDMALVSIAKLADIARQDPSFLQVGELYRDDAAFDVEALVADLVAVESVPLMPILRYKPSGLRKHAEWEQTWELQRREDAGEIVGEIPVPPKFTSADFISTGGARYWSLRGKLDVPKERWISFPHCEGPDGTLVIAWAGYDHLQHARAISAYYVRVQTEFGGTDDPRLIPLLACLIELLPWLKQWHNDPDAAFDGMRMGDYFEGFVNEEARQLNKTIPEIKAWTPPAKGTKRGRRSST